MRSAGCVITLLVLFGFGCGRSSFTTSTASRIGSPRTGGNFATAGVGDGGSGLAGGQVSSGDTAGAAAGGPPTSGGTVAGSAPSSARESSDHCETIEQLPKATVPVCSLTPGDSYEPDYSGCPDSSVDVAMDSDDYYFVVNHGQQVIRCPIGNSNPRVFEDVKGRDYDWIVDTLDGQIKPNGLIRFVCQTDQYTGSNYSFRTTCSRSGIRTGQPDLKAGGLYVLFPDRGSDAGAPGYGAEIYGYSCYQSASEPCPKVVNFYTVNNGTRTMLGTQPLTYSSDRKTLSFNDRNGRPVTIVLDSAYEVTDVQW